MKAPAEPGWKTERAICETTESVELGRACRWTARYETPRKSVIAIVPRIASVWAAFFPCGFLNALTPFAIASTPVRAVDPDENARRSAKSVIVPTPAGSAFGVTAWCACPVAISKIPARTSVPIARTKRYVGSAKRRPDSRTPRRLARTMSASAASESATLCELSEGTNDVIAKMPAEIETATVST